MDFSFFLDCWWVALYISIWQSIYLAIIIAVAYVVGKICDSFFSDGKRWKMEDKLKGEL